MTQLAYIKAEPNNKFSYATLRDWSARIVPCAEQFDTYDEAYNRLLEDNPDAFIMDQETIEENAKRRTKQIAAELARVEEDIAHYEKRLEQLRNFKTTYSLD